MTISELKTRKEDFSIKQGVIYDVFKVGIPQLKFETEGFAKRIFDECNDDKTSNYLDWEHFLLAVKAIRAKSIEQKIDLFFKIVD